jgi:hypothetical protein
MLPPKTGTEHQEQLQRFQHLPQVVPYPLDLWKKWCRSTELVFTTLGAVQHNTLHEVGD